MLATKSREFIRHPSDIPISVSNDRAQKQTNLALNNISAGGLAFKTPSFFETGSVVTIRISSVKPRFKIKGIVAWCEPADEHFEVGVEFIGHQDAYKVRMVEQVCHIEQYKKTVQSEEGRKLSGESAAAEWIEKFASSFPNP